MSFFLDESRRLRTAWRLMIFGAANVAVVVAMNVVIGLGMVGYLATTGRLRALATSPQAEARAEMEALVEEWTLPLSIALALPLAGISLALAALCRKYLDRRSIKSLGFERPRRGLLLSIVAGCAVGAAPIVLIAGALWLAGGFQFTGVDLAPLTLLVVPALVCMAFAEEIEFRGYVQRNLLDVGWPTVGIVISSAAFWLAHSFNPHVWDSPWCAINLLSAGLLLALAYQWSGNLWFPWAAHFAWNFAQGPLLGIPISGIEVPGLVRLTPDPRWPAWLTGGEFGLEGSALATAANLAMIAALLVALWAQRRSRGIEREEVVLATLVETGTAPAPLA
jgi:membrane protease YdiL (CAAX protease family)